MRPSTVAVPLASILLALAAATASAQNSTPPKLDPVPDNDTPITVTPKSNRETTTTVQRDGGRIVQETVQAGGSTYAVKPANPNSTQLPGDAGGPQVRGPQWTVMEFDIAKKQKQRSADAAAAAAADNAADVPPPPPMPPVTE
ncbi:hypothetical protein [Pseudoduganella lutea]|uniref:hypothetical protein n=1 Tax=Pseudoduganella lutea TaxID=321985 RepID=UPI001A933258|nr:hypothetical protein [Pseudoduganella lutea]